MKSQSVKFVTNVNPTNWDEKNTAQLVNLSREFGVWVNASGSPRSFFLPSCESENAENPSCARRFTTVSGSSYQFGQLLHVLEACYFDICSANGSA